jgi:CheY-like chemotaxis protein
MRVLIAHAKGEARTKLADVVTRGRRLSLDILTAGDGPDTLDLLLAEDPPEVALIDWDLPGIEAPEMCRLVRDFHHHHDTWIIVLTPQAHRESASEVWRAGADDCVYTPAPAKLLSDRVTKGLCEMSPPMREAAAAAAAAAAAVDAAAADAASPTAASPTAAAGKPAAAAWSAGSGPVLDAVCRPDDEVQAGGFAGLPAALKATVDPEDFPGDGTVELEARPATLSARGLDLDDCGEASPSHATLKAVLLPL